MTTDTKTTVTPFDDAFYAPDWRYRLAVACAEDPMFKHPATRAMQDKTVKSAVRHLKAKSSKSVKLRSDRARFDQVRRWGTDGPHRHTGHVIEALLLTDAPMEAIAEDMGCEVATLVLYEKLFFNVRDKDGQMSLAPAQKQFFATEGTFKPTTQRPEHLMWRRVAVSAGYNALVEILELGSGNWSEAPRVDLVDVTTRMAKAETLAMVAAGGLSASELAKLEANRLKGQLIRHQTGEAKVKDEGMELALELMQLMAPKMVEHQAISRAQALTAAENMRMAEENIAGTPVDDSGQSQSQAAFSQKLQTALAPLAKEYSKRGEHVPS
jgi:hypothetical protein